MSSTTLEPTAAHPTSHWRALALCLLMFVVYIVLVQAIARFGAPVFKALPTPNSAPLLWWRVDKNVALVGLSDLIAAVLPVFVYLRLRRRRLADLGYNRPGTWLAWTLVLVAQAGLIYSDTHMGAVGRAPGFLGSYALLASVIVGPLAAFSEETFFRGFLMDTLQRGGFGTVLQVVISALFFGVAHLGYVRVFNVTDLSIPVFTGLLGAFWSFVYVLGKRSLWPTIAAHIINDAVLIPSVFYLLVVARG
jgi:membrane protease YdiL (CAAX protease family)